MYNLNDTIVAVSSPAGGARSIIRITGPATIEICRQIFESSNSSIALCPSSFVHAEAGKPRPSSLPLANAHGSVSSIVSVLMRRSITFDDDLEIDAVLYLFFAPHSYTGDDVAEVHIYAGRPVIESLMNRLMSRGLRTAGPGEFTARAYLNGKIDLAQAEAVNEIVVSSNTLQLAAAQKLLSGRLGQTTENLRCQILDCLSLLEAGLDFSEETIEFATKEELTGKLTDINEKLSKLLIESSRLESVLDLPAVGISGVPNAGKSSLLNKLLGRPRSIVSPVRKTTRDVLTGELTLRHNRCVLFDCAGLIGDPTDDGRRLASTPVVPVDSEPRASASGYRRGTMDESIIDELARQAAIDALRNSAVVIFCVDISKKDFAEDAAILRLIEPRTIILVATKCDLVAQADLEERLHRLAVLFSAEFLPISAETGLGLEKLRDAVDKKLTENLKIPPVNGLALTARHRQAIVESCENINTAIKEARAGHDEIAAMTLRAAYQCICDIERPEYSGIDEQILEQIFSRFCIGK